MITMNEGEMRAQGGKKGGNVLFKNYGEKGQKKKRPTGITHLFGINVEWNQVIRGRKKGEKRFQCVLSVL